MSDIELLGSYCGDGVRKALPGAKSPRCACTNSATRETS